MCLWVENEHYPEQFMLALEEFILKIIVRLGTILL